MNEIDHEVKFITFHLSVRNTYTSEGMIYILARSTVMFFNS